MSKVLVTGAAGFIGSHVCDELLRQGHEVVGLDDLSGGFKENVPAGVLFLEGDICDEKMIDVVFLTQKFDYVIHAAAYAAEGLSHFIRRFNYRNNLLGSVNLINASVKYGLKGFVFLSSIAVYGDQQPPFSEDKPPAPIDPYGIAKWAAEMDLRAAYVMFGLPYIIFRPHNVYGERQNLADSYRNVIGIFMNQAMQGEPMTIFGSGYQTRAFSHVYQVAAAIADSIEREDCWGHVFNIGGDKTTSVIDLSRMVAIAMRAPHEPCFLPARHEAMFAFCDHTKARAFFPKCGDSLPLELGLFQMALWAQKKGPQKPSRFGEIELTQNLPPSWQQLL